MFDNTPAADWPAFFRDRRLAPSLARAARRGRPAATSLLEAVRRLLPELPRVLSGAASHGQIQTPLCTFCMGKS
jgi:fructosamine-3-kinase